MTGQPGSVLLGYAEGNGPRPESTDVAEGSAYWAELWSTLWSAQLEGSCHGFNPQLGLPSFPAGALGPRGPVPSGQGRPFGRKVSQEMGPVIRSQRHCLLGIQ